MTTNKKGHGGFRRRGPYEPTLARQELLRQALRKEPHIGLEAIARNLGWPYPKLLGVLRGIRHEYKKVWVHWDDYPEFWTDKKPCKEL